MTTALAHCPCCDTERVVKILDCDTCFEHYRDRGGDPANYTDLHCEHLVCLTCGESLS